MSPIAKCHRDEQAQARKEIHGTRPSPLKISRDSHLICKKTWSSSSSSIIPSEVQDSEPHNRDDDDHHQLQRKTKHPIIIYTHSPKVIHTQPRDFMALVQKLTGLSRTKNDESNASLSQSAQGRSLKKSSSPWDDDDDNIKDQHMLVAVNSDHDNESSSGITNDEIQLNPSSEPYLTNMPLFTPNAKDLFPSSKPIHSYADSSPMGIVTSAFSPSGFDFFSGLSEY